MISTSKECRLCAFFSGRKTWKWSCDLQGLQIADLYWTRPLPTRSHTGHERSGQRETSHSHRGGWIPPPPTRLAGAQPLNGDAPLSLIMTKSTGQAPTSPAVIGVPSARFLGPSHQIDK